MAILGHPRLNRHQLIQHDPNGCQGQKLFIFNVLQSNSTMQLRNERQSVNRKRFLSKTILCNEIKAANVLTGLQDVRRFNNSLEKMLQRHGGFLPAVIIDTSIRYLVLSVHIPRGRIRTLRPISCQSCARQSTQKERPTDSQWSRWVFLFSKLVKQIFFRGSWTLFL